MLLFRSSLFHVDLRAISRYKPLEKSLGQMGKQFHTDAIKLEPGLFLWFQSVLDSSRASVAPSAGQK